jgi:hypothetical protein
MFVAVDPDWQLLSLGLISVLCTGGIWVVYAMIRDLRSGRRAMQECFLDGGNAKLTNAACIEVMKRSLFPVSVVIMHTLTVGFWVSVSIFLVSRSKNISALLMSTRQLRRCVVDFETSRLADS